MFGQFLIQYFQYLTIIEKIICTLIFDIIFKNFQIQLWITFS